MLAHMINMYNPILNFLDALINLGVQIRKGDDTTHKISLTQDLRKIWKTQK